jgi:hypothetical protein
MLVEIFAHCVAEAVQISSKEEEVKSLETISSELIDEVDNDYPQMQSAFSERRMRAHSHTTKTTGE